MTIIIATLALLAAFAALGLGAMRFIFSTHSRPWDEMGTRQPTYDKEVKLTGWME